MNEPTKIFLRKANLSDIEFLWRLRNQPNVYKYSRNGRPVSWEEHINWISPIISGASNKVIFVIKSAGVSIGQIRFDHQNNKKAEVSISILKEFRGKGFGGRSLNMAIKKIKKQDHSIEVLAEINKNNIPSIRLFEKIGFKLKAKNKFWLEYSLQ